MRGDTMDLGQSFGKAVEAARRGDVDSLEVELARLRNVRAQGVAGVGTRLRALASAVRAHPSFKPVPAAQAG